MIIELRVPPEALGSSLVFVITIGVFVAALTPLVAYLPMPIPFIVIIVVAVLTVFVTFFLPEGGQFLPGVQKISDSVT